MTDWGVLVQSTLAVIDRLVLAMQLLSSKAIVLITVAAAGSPPAGEDDGKNTHVILAAPVSSFPPKAGETNKWSEAGIQLKYASGVAGHNRRLRRRNNAASKRLCHATRDDISIAGSPPAGEDDGLGGFL